jgi:hypothetical protein
MKEPEKEITAEIFENQVLSKIRNEEDKLFFMNAFLKDEKAGRYILKDRLKEDIKIKIMSILESISYLPEEEKQRLKNSYNYVENYFLKKKAYFEDYKSIPIEEIIRNAPRYYTVLRVIEQVNIFLSNDKNWLKNFVANNKINFDWEGYERWKSGKDSQTTNYDDTSCPSKWIQLIQEKLIEVLKAMQILICMEFYIDEEKFKKFLKANPTIDYKYKANYIKPLYPFEELDTVFKVIDQLLMTSMENDLRTKAVIDTTVCVKAYRFIDDSSVFEILKRKEFYIKFHFEYLLKTTQSQRMILPYEEDIIKVAADLLEMLKDLYFTYNEYKKRLILKYDKVKNRLNK